MRCLIVGLNYRPESTSIGPYTADLAEYLQRAGHDVRVVTGFPIAPQWRMWEGYGGSLFRRQLVNGVRVLRAYLQVPQHPERAGQRILFDTSFALSALIGGVATGRSDVVMVVSPPLQLGVTGWLLARLWRAPLLFHIQDLVPEAAAATGMLPSQHSMMRLGRLVERFVYSQSTAIGVICDGFERYLVSAGVAPNKIAMLPNYVDLEFMQPAERDNVFRLAQGLGRDHFVVMYSGSVALKQGLETFVEAAAHLTTYPKIHLYLIGEGPYLDQLKRLASRLGLRNLVFLKLGARRELPAQLGAADALVITQRKAVGSIVFPGKLLYYMAAARPIIASVDAASETGRFVRDNAIGVVVRPEDPGALAAAIVELYKRGPRKFGQNGRRLVEAQFDRRVVLSRFEKRIASLVD